MSTIDKKFDKWFDWVKTMECDHGNGNHFSHITRNLLQGISCAKESPDVLAELWAVIDLYRSLIEQYPSFLDGEFGNSTHGYFPDIPSSGGDGGSHAYYVIEAAKKLDTLFG